MQLDDLRRVVERDVVLVGHSTPHLVVETPHRQQQAEEDAAHLSQ